MTKMLLTVLAFVLATASPAAAESPFELNNHLSVLNIATAKVDGSLPFLAAGYHFNLIRAGRFEFLGAGLGLEVHQPPEMNDIESLKFGPAFTGQIIDVIIGDPTGDTSGAFGVGVMYLPDSKSTRLFAGFSIRLR